MSVISAAHTTSVRTPVSSRDPGGNKSVLSSTAALARGRALLADTFILQLVAVFLAYYIAGTLGQATTAIRSGNLGPVWPASGIALAAVLTYGHRIWPALMLSGFVVAYQSPVFVLTAIGQATGGTLAALYGALLLRRVAGFDPSLPRLRDALALIVRGAFGSAIVSATIGIASLYGTRLEPYSDLISAWVIYWLGDATGVLLVLPLVFTAPMLLAVRVHDRVLELVSLLALLTAVCFLIFGDLPLFSTRLHVLAFAVLPFVMWAAISFGVGGASLSVFLVAVAATLLTALGHGPFSDSTPFVNAALLDVLFTALAVSGLTLAAVIAERERAERERERLVHAQASMEARLRLAAIVESSNDAVVSMTLEGIIQSWNEAAQRIFGFTAAEAIGQPMALLIPAALRDESARIRQRVATGQRIAARETIRVTKAGQSLPVSLTVSPVLDADGNVIGAATIIRDITQNKLAEAALAGVSRRLIEAQEQERSRIARELHDDIGQRLAVLSVNLSRLREERRDWSRFETQAIALQQQAGDIAADIQALSHKLHSSRLEILGLAAAARHFCEEFASQQKVVVEFESRALPSKPPAAVSLCLFRILQEALHNAAKHSGVRRFDVRLWERHGRVHLLVRDGGQGFDLAARRTGRGIGLISMEERIKLVDGDLSIHSEPQHGTTIHARVDVGPAAPARPLPSAAGGGAAPSAVNGDVPTAAPRRAVPLVSPPQ